MLALDVDVEKVGQRMFRRLVDDLKSLETNGIEVRGHHFGVNVSAIAGDNLGSHWLGGFVTNFSTVPHMCRYCTLNKSDFDRGCLWATTSQLRTVDSYNDALAELANGNVKVCAGIKFNSIFNNLTSFHVCNPGLPPCVAHDLFEGVVCYDVPLFLKSLIHDVSKSKNQKQFSLATLNKRLECFELHGADSAVRPPLLKSSFDRLSGTASQNWCLLRITPLLIEYIVETDNAVYQVLLLLRSVIELVMAPRISIGQVAEMRVLIEDYLTGRRCLFFFMFHCVQNIILCHTTLS